MFQVLLVVCFAYTVPTAPGDPDFGAQEACYAADYFDSRRFARLGDCTRAATAHSKRDGTHREPIARLALYLLRAPSRIEYRCSKVASTVLA